MQIEYLSGLMERSKEHHPKIKRKSCSLESRRWERGTLDAHEIWRCYSTVVTALGNSGIQKCTDMYEHTLLRTSASKRFVHESPHPVPRQASGLEAKPSEDELTLRPGPGAFSARTASTDWKREKARSTRERKWKSGGSTVTQARAKPKRFLETS